MLKNTAAVRHNFNKEIPEHLLQRKYFPPYNLAQDLYNSNEENLNRYTTKKSIKPRLPPQGNYINSNDEIKQATKALRNTKLLTHNLDEDYKDYFFIPNYDENDLIEYFDNDEQNYDLLDDFVLPDPLNYDADDLGNIQFTGNNPSYNKSLIPIDSSSKKPRGTKVHTDTESIDSSLFEPFVHPDHYHYRNTGLDDKNLFQTAYEHNTNSDSNSYRHKHNFQSVSNHKIPSTITYDLGDWKPISMHRNQVLQSKPFHLNHFKSKRIRFPKDSKSVIKKGQLLPFIQTPLQT